jgi:hypothetical protein
MLVLGTYIVLQALISVVFAYEFHLREVELEDNGIVMQVKRAIKCHSNDEVRTL